MKFLKALINRFPEFRRPLVYARKFTLPGFGRVPLYQVGKFFIEELKRDSINVRASSIAFNFLLATFPSIIFLFSLIPYLRIENFQESLLDLMFRVLPETTHDFINSTITDLINVPRGGLLSVGVFLTLFFASNGVMSLMHAFDKKDHLGFKSRKGYMKRLIALQLTIILLVLLIITVISVIFGQIGVSKLIVGLGLDPGLTNILTDFMRFVIMFMLLFNSIALIYKLAPATTKRWRYFSPGAMFATILSIFTSYVFFSYINNFNNYNKLYGSLGTFIAIMVLLYINALVLLVGFELNNSIVTNRIIRDKKNLVN